MDLRSLLLAWMVAMGLGAATLVGWMLIDHSPAADGSIVLILWLNVLIMLLGISAELTRRPYSLHLMHLVSLFLFLGAASLLQYSKGYLGMAGPIALLEDQLMRSVVVVTLWTVGYLVAYELRYFSPAVPSGKVLNRQLSTGPALLVAMLGIASLGYLAVVGLWGVGTRGAANEALEAFASQGGDLGSPIFILTTNVARALPPVALLTSLLLLRSPSSRRAAMLPWIAVLTLGTLTINNPFAHSRMFLTCSLIAFSSVFFFRRLKTGTALLTAIMTGLVVLPALGEARHALDLKEVQSIFQLVSPLDYLANSSDVDLLGMTTLTQQYVDENGIHWGRQMFLVTVIWIPRAFWPTKPVGTGTMVSEAMGFSFTNLAAPIPAEALVNFGIFGVPLVGALFGWVLARLDKIYWAQGRRAIGQSYRIIDATYPFWLVCIVYFTRGDWVPAVVFTGSYSVWIIPLAMGAKRLAQLPTRLRSFAETTPGLAPLAGLAAWEVDSQPSAPEGGGDDTPGP